MGKLKKTPKKDEKQKTISSFFKMGSGTDTKTSRPTKSLLFTTVDQSLRQHQRPASASKQEASGTRTNDPVIIDEEKFTSISAASNRGASGDHALGTLQHRRNNTADGRKPAFPIDDCNHSASNVQANSTTISCIPETQLVDIVDTDVLTGCRYTSKEGSPVANDVKRKNSLVDKTPDSLDSREEDVIPDTPDAVKSNSRRVLKSSRSFLSSSSSLINPMHPGLVKKKSKTQVKPNKGRNFEEAYREMLNKQAEVDGDKLEKGDVTALMISAGMPAPSSDRSRHQSHSSKSISESPISLTDKCTFPCEKNTTEQTKPEALVHTPVISEIAHNKRSDKSKVLGSLSGLKRASTKGDSPSAKRHVPGSPGSRHVRHSTSLSADKKHCRRQLSLDADKKNTSSDVIMTGKKCKSWDVEASVCDDDSVLSDILNEMKQRESQPAVTQGKLPKPKLKTEHPCEENINMESYASGTDADLGDVLTDIIQELKNKTPKVKCPKSSLVKSGRKYGMKKSFRPCQLSQNTSPEAGHLIEDVQSDKMQANCDITSDPVHMESRLSQDFSKLSPFKMPSYLVSEKPSDDGDPLCAEFGRYKVLKIERSMTNMTLDVLSVIDNKQRKIILEGFWQDVHLSEDDIVHVVGKFDTDDVCVITDKENFIIVDPDTLISGTTVVGTVYCMRKSVLNERFKGFEGKNIYMLYGSIIHAVFQQVMEEKVTTAQGIKNIAEKIIKQIRFMHDMYGQALEMNKVREEIDKYVPQMVKFMEKQESFAAGLASPKENEVAINRIADIEENIWCPQYGIKGKIDLTVAVKCHEKGRGWVKRVMPLELKTGRPSFSVEHKGQVTLYSMMSAERREDPQGGVLLYLKDNSMKTIPADPANKRGLIQLRNEFAHYLKRGLRFPKDGSRWSGGLPQPINNERSCGKCPQLLNCCAYQKAVEGWDAPAGHAMATLTESALGHLQDKHLSFYFHWARLLHMEMATEGKRAVSPSDIWTKTTAARESSGSCIRSLSLISASRISEPKETPLYTHTFRRTSSFRGIAVCDVGPGKGEGIVVSAENKPWICVAMGTIINLTRDTVDVVLDRDLCLYEEEPPVVYCLDKCDTYNTMGINFTNLARLMDNLESSAKLRRLLIEKHSPEFDLTMSKSNIEKMKPIFRHLNKPQKAAVLKVLMSKDYVLIKGYPGTGKTSTIVSLVRILASLGLSVLLASYTHSAVDNILLKLKQHDVDFIRLGRLSRIHPDIQPYASEVLTKQIDTVAGLAQFYQSKSIVATTCLGVNHPVFTQRVFDVCIVDEASQVLQPACLGPLFASKRFVLVGDPLQLPPVVQSKQAREDGMAESLFARLDDTGATYELNLQYRMNAEIMRLSNALVYDGALQCGSSRVAEGQLHAPLLTQALQHEADWVHQAMGRQQAVCFLDTQQIVSGDAGDSESGITSTIEAAIVMRLVCVCVKASVKQDDIGIISPYRQQVRLLRDLLNSQGHGSVEVNTVDQYQGRDKPLIIVSFVKSSSEGHTSEILKDVCRLNVALTRAKHKLLLVGNSGALKQYESLAELLSLLHPEQMNTLPADVPR